MTVHQCPLCELRFADRWEVEAHLADEHPRRIQPGFPSTAAWPRVAGAAVRPRDTGRRDRPVR
ncbi:MAG: hypothetical protein M5U14_03010 [Acidimicrobiia bacterium]|nr:hypothetical protein [Acidimicrobiia bacterium]